MDDKELASDATSVETRRGRWSWRGLWRTPNRWVAPCRDEARRRRALLVVVTDDDRIALVVPPGEVAVLDSLAVGVLRAALRDAVFAVAAAADRPRRSWVPLTRRSAGSPVRDIDG